MANFTVGVYLELTDGTSQEVDRLNLPHPDYEIDIERIALDLILEQPGAHHFRVDAAQGIVQYKGHIVPLANFRRLYTQLIAKAVA